MSPELPYLLCVYASIHIHIPVQGRCDHSRLMCHGQCPAWDLSTARPCVGALLSFPGVELNATST